MYKGSHITVIIPAHNEERLVAQVLDDLPSLVDRILLVDDCSTDATAQVAEARSDERLHVIRSPRNLGVGGAMVLGFHHALKEPTDILVKVDGDGQMPLDHLTDLLDAILEGGADYAKGNRFLLQQSLKTMPKVRLLGNVVLTFLTKLSSGYWHVFDPQNGFLAIRAEALRTVRLDQISNGYFFENDMLVQLNISRRRVVDVPIPSIYGDEESGVNIVKICLAFPVLLLSRFGRRIYLKYVLRDFSPIALFLIMGSVLFGGGAAFGALAWTHSAVTGVAASTGTVMLSILPLILGFQLLLQAVVLDIEESRALIPEYTPHIPGTDGPSRAASTHD